MELDVGSEVVDKNGEFIGTIDHLVRNTISGEVDKYVVFREEATGLFFTLEDVAEAEENWVKLSISVDEHN